MITRVIDSCARHRVGVLLATGFLLLLAVGSIRRIKLDAIPDLSDPQVIVFTEWMGRSPTLVEDQVSYPIVSQLLSAPRVTDVRGFSMFGMSFVYVLFEEGTDLYWARSRVLEYLSGLKDRLPQGAEPVLGPDATGIGWIFQYVLVDKSGRHSLAELRTFQDFTLRYAIGSVQGVAEVAGIGGYEKQYQVIVDPARLRTFGLTVPEIASAVRGGSGEVGGRILEASGREYYVRGRGWIGDLDDVGDIVLRATGPGGTPLRVRDVAELRFGPELRRGLLEWNGEGEAVGAIVVMRHGENAREVIERVKSKIDELRPSLPEGVELEIGYDRSALIDRAIETLWHALLEEGIVVSLVILLFLLHFRSSLLAILSLPAAVALAFIPMELLGIPATIMSLGGIAIAIGATVDAVIVMIEACHKKLEHAQPGDDRARLLREAAHEVTPAIFFALLVVAVAFVPVFGLTGQAGRLFKPLAWSKTFVMLASALLSVTFAPALLDWLMRGRIWPEEKHPLSRGLIALYRPFVWVAMRRPISTAMIGALALASAVPLAMKLGHEFMPPLQEGDLLYMPTTLPNISIEEAKRQLQIQDRLLRSFPEVESVFGKVGRAETATDAAPLTMVETTVRLKPAEDWRTTHDARWWSGWAPEPLAAVLRPLWPDERRITWEELSAEMHAKMRLPGWTNAYTMPIRTRVDMLSTGVRTPVGVKVFGTDLEVIEGIGTGLERLLKEIPGTRSVLYERNLGGLYVDIEPDRAAMARHGLRVDDVQATVEAAIGGEPVLVTLEGRARYTVNVRLAEDARSDVDALRRLLLPRNVGPGGGGGDWGSGGAASGGGAMGGGGSGAGMGGGGAGLGAALGGGGPGMGGGMASGAMAASGSPLAGLDAGGMGGGVMAASADAGMPGGAGSGVAAALAWDPLPRGPGLVQLGEVAEIKVVSGPPMLRDEDGLLAGYVFADIDVGRRDIGGWVKEAKEKVAAARDSGELAIPSGYFLQWTGQYELMEQMLERMKLLIPITLAVITLLLFLQFRNLVEVGIVLLSIPFALVGSIWLMWALDYRLSTAVWVGLIALVGLAAQTGIVMIVYLDNAYRAWKQAGRIHGLSDIVAAHMEGTVQRVRPKLMTVGTMFMGLVPLLWATGSGADVMKRIAAPMVGGLLTSAFLTLEIIPVIATYWRYEELLWERLEGLDARMLGRLRGLATAHGLAWAGLALLAVAPIYSSPPAGLLPSAAAVLGLAVLGSGAAYLAARRGARKLAWP